MRGEQIRQRSSAMVRDRLARLGRRLEQLGECPGPDQAKGRDPVPVEYAFNHNTGETLSLEEARLKIGEWQPESERAELAAFLADTDPLDIRSRDFVSVESGNVSLSRGVTFVPAPPLTPAA